MNIIILRTNYVNTRSSAKHGGGGEIPDLTGRQVRNLIKEEEAEGGHSSGK